ncbi:putative metalloprotease CJM1_0395 family protein [Pseudaeromonas paramecii]|uniref:Metalloprotease CJM1_0395 family protein n=1 Tax=Pseudaeromonas paramecii TaxID=2138166 RepID=A0ABP8QIR8_9GAMM
MNISPTYPNLVPIALQPSTESARRDNQVRERIPALPQGEASPRESQVGSDKERFRSQEGRNTSYDSRQNGQAGSSADGAFAVEGKPDRQQGQGSQQGESRSGDEGRQQRQEASQEQQVLAEFKDRDQEVRDHEQAHQRAGGQYAGSPSYSVTRGPDGNSYAIGGEVQIDVSPVSGDPQATIRKMQQVRAAALAPAEPSSQDRAVAARTQQLEAQARAELMEQTRQLSLDLGSQQTDTAAAAGTEAQVTSASDASPVSQPATPRANPFGDGVSQAALSLMSQRNQVIAQRYDSAWQGPAGATVSRYA